MKELSLHILDIVQNSIRAQSTCIQIVVSEDLRNDRYVIEIEDNGTGVDEETLRQLADPFYTTRSTRKVGLGLSLLKQNAEQTGGELAISSEKGKGTKLKAVFAHANIDRPIMGDIAGTMILLIGSNPSIHFIYKHQTALSTFELDSKELKEELEGVPLTHPDIRKAVGELINENLEMIEAHIN
ncbi:ATP-binding protein [Roseimarinus sediminis]|jgi:hypothetical protein|uniref:ATP-binding protein n=1 Tax=Roseimarinus sediminis TaxID=1610899 RepID=UPI003D1B9F73